MLLVPLALVGAVPLSIGLLASMMTARGLYAVAAAVALGLDIILTFLAGPTGMGVLLAILPFATALALVWAEQRPGPSMLGLVGFAILGLTIVAPRFDLIGTSFEQAEVFVAIGSAASAAGTIWGAWVMPIPAPTIDAPTATPARVPRSRAPLDARLAAWLIGVGLLLGLSMGAVPWRAPGVVLSLALALLAVPALVALRETPPAGITLGALALLGMVPFDGCAVFDAMTGACGELPGALAYLWVVTVAAVAWIGLALGRS